MKTDRDLIIIGAGAAGLTAAQYGARANLNVLVLEELAPGGQAIIIDDLENYPGFPEPIKGFDFSQRMEQQARRFGADFDSTTVESVTKEEGIFKVKTSGEVLTAKTVILATGAKHRHLNVPGEEEFAGRGVSYCATCDGPFFKNKKILVVGGGDAACDESMYLSKLTDKVILVHRRDRFRAQKAVGDRVINNPNIQVRFNTECREILGEGQVKKAKLYNSEEDREYEEEVDAVFIFIGSIPQTGMVKDVDLDEAGYILTDEFMEAKTPGLFVAGDVRATPFRQLIVAAGEGAIAAHYASHYIDRMAGQEYK